MKTGVVIWERTEEEKRRRHLHGDKGATFKGGKQPKIDVRGVLGAITTLVTKDIQIVEMYEKDDFV